MQDAPAQRDGQMACRATACCRAASAPRRAERACGAGRLAHEPCWHQEAVHAAGRAGPAFGQFQYPTPPLPGRSRPNWSTTHHARSPLCRAPRSRDAAKAATAGLYVINGDPRRGEAPAGRRTRHRHCRTARRAHRARQREPGHRPAPDHRMAQLRYNKVKRWPTRAVCRAARPLTHTAAMHGPDDPPRAVCPPCSSGVLSRSSTATVRQVNSP